MEDIIEKLARVLNVYWELEPKTKEIIDGREYFIRYYASYSTKSRFNQIFHQNEY